MKYFVLTTLGVIAVLFGCQQTGPYDAGLKEVAAVQAAANPLPKPTQKPTCQVSSNNIAAGVCCLSNVTPSYKPNWLLYYRTVITNCQPNEMQIVASDKKHCYSNVDSSTSVLKTLISDTQPFNPVTTVSPTDCTPAASPPLAPSLCPSTHTDTTTGGVCCVSSTSAAYYSTASTSCLKDEMQIVATAKCWCDSYVESLNVIINNPPTNGIGTIDYTDAGY